jgi:hypothetical protein
MSLLSHRRLQYIGEESLGVVGGYGGILGAGVSVALDGKKPDIWASPISRSKKLNGL